MGERGGVAGGVGQAVDCCSLWLEPEGLVFFFLHVMLIECFQSECMLVARPANVLKIQY